MIEKKTISPERRKQQSVESIVQVLEADRVVKKEKNLNSSTKFYVMNPKEIPDTTKFH